MVMDGYSGGLKRTPWDTGYLQLSYSNTVVTENIRSDARGLHHMEISLGENNDIFYELSCIAVVLFLLFDLSFITHGVRRDSGNV